MPREYYIKQIQKLESDLVHMGEHSLDLLSLSLRSLETKDIDLARKVMGESERMAGREIELENDCIALLALQQPMASDLRLISTSLKILTDLGRLSRLAWNISSITIKVGDELLLPEIKEILNMYNMVAGMVRDSLKAFINRDVNLAMSLGAKDDMVDAQYDRIRRKLIDEMIKDPSSVDIASHLSFVARYLERAGDHACSIASWTVYMVKGERVRIM